MKKTKFSDKNSKDQASFVDKNIDESIQKISSDMEI